LADGFPLAQQNVGAPKLLNDLFGVVSFLRHGSDLLRWLFTTFNLDQIFGARSLARCLTEFWVIGPCRKANGRISSEITFQ
jgi:hypothetical protein